MRLLIFSQSKLSAYLNLSIVYNIYILSCRFRTISLFFATFSFLLFVQANVVKWEKAVSDDEKELEKVRNDEARNMRVSIPFYTPPHKKWRGIMLYPPNFECPSVCLSALRFHALTLVPFDLFSSNFAKSLVAGRSGMGLQVG